MDFKEKILLILFIPIISLASLFIIYHSFKLYRFKKCTENNFKYDYCKYYIDY